MRTIPFTFFLLISFLGFSQKVKILDQETGENIKNVSIFNKNKTKLVISDETGSVDISTFLASEVLYFSHISYAEFQTKKNDLTTRGFIIYLAKESEQLDEIVLSVFKKKAKTNRIAEQVAVLSRQDIQRVSPQTSADLLATIPGIKVQKSQFGGGSPVLRGMESNRVLLVVDGVRLNNAIYRKGHLQSSITVSPNLLERTEVVFGPSSVIYGSDALGGVIHYYTKTPKLSKDNTVSSQLFLRFSTVNQEITTNVSAELSFEKWASLTSISYSNFGDLKMGKNRSHGFNDWGKVFYYSENLNGNYAENPTQNSDINLQQNTGFTQTDVLQKFFVPLSKKIDLNINIQYSTSSDIPRFDRLTELTDETDNTSLKFAEWYYGPQQRLLISSQLIINPEKNWLDKGTLTFAYQNIKESRIKRKFESLNRSYREEKVNVFSLNGDFSVPLAKNRNLGYGFEFVYNDVRSNSFGKTLNISNNSITGFSGYFNVQSRYPDGGSNYFSSAMYADYRQDISKKSTLNTGIRLTHTRLNATWIDQTFITFPKTDINLNNTAITATVGYVYKPNRNWQLNSVLSSGFRSPNIDDVGRVREKGGNVTVPNITLKPEHAYNAEVGIQKYFNNRKFRIGGSLYYTLLNNYIQRDVVFNTDGSQRQINFDGELGNAVANQNKGTAYITGFTTSYQGKLFPNWKTSGFVTYTKGKTFDAKEPMSSIPPFFGQFDVNYKKEKLAFGAQLRFNSKKDISNFNISEGIDNHDLTPIIDINATEPTDKYYGSPSWITLGVNGTYTMSKRFSFIARLDNLFDKYYREFASGISAPGRNLSISFLVRL